MRLARLEEWTLPAIRSSVTFRVGLGVLISAFSVYFVLHNVDYADIWSALMQADARYAALGLLSVAINTAGKAIRWKILVGPGGKHIHFSRYLMVLLVGQMLNTLIPAKVGELSRAYIVGGMGPGRAFVLGTIVIEKFLDAIAYMLLFVLLLGLMPLPAGVRESSSALILVGVVLGVIMAGLMLQRDMLPGVVERLTQWLPVRVQAQVVGMTSAALRSLNILKQQAELLQLILWTMLIWGTAVLTNYLTLLALGMHLPIAASVLILVVLQVGIAVPSVPGRIGVFELGCVWALAVFGVAQAAGLTYGIVLHAIVLVPSTLIGLLFFWMMGSPDKQSIQEHALPEVNQQEL